MKCLVFAGVLALSAITLSAAPFAAQAQEDVGGLTNPTLVTTLTGLGYEPKALKKGYLIQLKRGTWTLYVQAVLSGDGTKLGLNANLGDVDADAVTREQWRDIVVLNGQIEPSSIYFDPDLKRLYLHRALDNRKMTASYLRTQLDIFMDQIQSTEKTWSPVAK